MPPMVATKNRSSFCVASVLLLLAGLQQAVNAAQAADDQQIGQDGLPGDPDPSVKDAQAWVTRYGGQVNFAVRRLQGKGRAAIAASDTHPGDVLASIPVELAYEVNYTWGPQYEAAGPQLVLDMADPNSFWQPLFRSMPPYGQVFSKDVMPEAYLPILQDENAERAVKMLHDNIHYYCQLLQPLYKQRGLSVSTAHCAHATALLSTRVFGYADRDVLIPFLELANHDNACQHTHSLESCNITQANEARALGLPPPTVPPSFARGVAPTCNTDVQQQPPPPPPPQQQQPAAEPRLPCEGGSAGVGCVSGVCMVWRAQTSVARGDELCHKYYMLLQDAALHQYGFLQKGPVELELSMLDRPEHSQDFDKVWDAPQQSSPQDFPIKFQGTPTQLWQEAQRLLQRLSVLQRNNDSLAGLKPDADLDPDGRYLSMLLEWRQQRLRAIQREVRRLKQQALEVDRTLFGLSDV